VMEPFVELVLREGVRSTRYTLALAGLGGDGAARSASVRRSESVAALLSERGHDGRVAEHTDTKWTGAHWYSPRSPTSAIDRGTRRCFRCATRFWSGCSTNDGCGGGAVDDVYLAPILMIAGRARIHASLEGNALDAVLALGLADQRVDAPAARLVESQWADGGWNCDRAPSASHSSLETLLPLRGL